MKIATYNVNGINGRLPVLLQWLKESAPDVVCLQELKAPQDKFPEEAIRETGLRCNLAWTEKLEWCCHPFKKLSDRRNMQGIAR
jgi:exodeoxyribonuclease-3